MERWQSRSSKLCLQQARVRMLTYKHRKLRKELRKARVLATIICDFDKATQNKMQVAWVRNINTHAARSPKFMIGNRSLPNS